MRTSHISSNQSDLEMLTGSSRRTKTSRKNTDLLSSAAKLLRFLIQLELQRRQFKEFHITLSWLTHSITETSNTSAVTCHQETLWLRTMMMMRVTIASNQILSQSSWTWHTSQMRSWMSSNSRLDSTRNSDLQWTSIWPRKERNQSRTERHQSRSQNKLNKNKDS